MYEYREGQTTHGVSSEDWLLWIRWSHLEHVYCIFIRAHCNRERSSKGTTQVQQDLYGRASEREQETGCQAAWKRGEK